MLADWAMIEDKFRVQNTSVVFGRMLGCPTDSSWRLLNCLRQGRSFYELGNAEFQVPCSQDLAPTTPDTLKVLLALLGTGGALEVEVSLYI